MPPHSGVPPTASPGTVQMSSSASPSAPRARFSLPTALVVVVTVALIVSGIQPYDRMTWLLETFWVVLGIPVAVVVWRRFPLTALLCWSAGVHALVLIMGGHYTYARTPRRVTGCGTCSACPQPVRPDRPLRAGLRAGDPGPRDAASGARRCAGSRWLAPLVVCGCLAFSAFFELIEWWAAVLGGSARRRLPRHPGRRLGHPVGHVPAPCSARSRRCCCSAGCTTASSPLSTRGSPARSRNGRAR